MTSIEDDRVDAMNMSLDILDMYENGILSIPFGLEPCVVFDIDDTLIDSRTRGIIYPMIILYRRIRSMGIPIFIVTARPPSSMDMTIDELKRHRLIGYEDIHMVDNYGDKAYRKARVRSYIEEQGYEIILNIGDAPGDMLYEHYVHGIKLPYLYDDE